MPARSRPEQHRLGSMPSMPRHTRWGSRPTGSPYTGTPSSPATAASTRSVSRRAARASASTSGAVASRRPRRRTRRSPGTFSIPARRARSWSPPTAAAAAAGPAARAARPRPAGRRACGRSPTAGRRRASSKSMRHVARRLRGVDVHEHAPLAARRHHLGHRLQRADLVVAPLHVHQRGVAAGWRPAPHRRRPGPGRSTPTMVTVAGPRRTPRAPPSARPPAPPGGRRARPTPHTAAAMASVAPLVNTTSRLRAPSSAGHLLAGVLDGHPRRHALLVDPARIAAGRAPATATIASIASGRGRRGRRVVEVVAQRSSPWPRYRRLTGDHRRPGPAKRRERRIRPCSSSFCHVFSFLSAAE